MCPTASGSFVLWPRDQLASPALGGRFLTTGSTREVLLWLISDCYKKMTAIRGMRIWDSPKLEGISINSVELWGLQSSSGCCICICGGIPTYTILDDRSDSQMHNFPQAGVILIGFQCLSMFLSQIIKLKKNMLSVCKKNKCFPSSLMGTPSQKRKCFLKFYLFYYSLASVI